MYIHMYIYVYIHVVIICHLDVINYLYVYIFCYLMNNLQKNKRDSEKSLIEIFVKIEAKQTHIFYSMFPGFVVIDAYNWQYIGSYS